MNNYAERHGDFEFHLLGVDLFITSLENPDSQVKLGYDAIEGMLGYLAHVGAVAGCVKLLQKGSDGACVYRATIESLEDPGKSTGFDFVIHKGILEDTAPVGSYDDTAEDDEEPEAEE